MLCHPAFLLRRTDSNKHDVRFGFVDDPSDFRVFVDVYATGPDIALGTGALWAFTRDMQVDLGTYVGLHGDEPVATPFLGFSVRR